MALIDLTSDLSWYGKTPPTVNNITDRDAKGFTAKEQQLNPSRFVGISDGQFSYTGPMGFGILGTQNNFDDIHNEGFTLNIMPKGSGRPDSQFLGITNTQYETTSLLGNLSDNIGTYSDDRQNTRFETDSSNIPFVNKGGGFDDHGATISIPPFLPRGGAAEDSFAINDATFDANGTATRQGQLGEGSPFVKHLGWSDTSKYSDSFNQGDLADNKATLSAGLVAKYIANTPIDDMYNKFKLREEAHDPYGYAKPPFILRGIQQDDKTDPQRWGTPGVFDIPRGGIVTAAERAALDAVRIGKFLIRPPGISFLIKQFGLQLTNPNTEGVDGTAKTNTFMTKLYDPLSPITNAVGGTLGLRTDRHFPPLVRAKTSTYEGVLKKRAALGLEAETSQNRLVKIRTELLGAGGGGAASGLLKLFGKIAAKVSGRPGEPITALTGLTGPGSLLGIGATTIRRHVTTPDVGDLDKLADSRKDIVNKETNKTTSKINIDFRNDGADYNEIDDNATHPHLGMGFLTALEESEFNGGGDEEGKDYTGTPNIGRTRYKTQPYDKLREEANTRFENQNTDRDFLTGEDYDTTTEENPLAKKTETVLDAGGEEVPFEGGGKADSTIEGSETTPLKTYKTNTYQQIKSKAADRTDSLNPIALDFRVEPSEDDPNPVYDRTVEAETSITKKVSEQDQNGNEFNGGGTNVGKGEADSPDADAPDLAPNETGHFTVLGYADLTRDNPNKRNFGYSKGSLGATYNSDQTLEGKYGYLKYDMNRSGIIDQGDPIQSLGEEDYGDVKDLINFKFQALRTSDELDNPSEQPIIFRAYINSVNDSFAPSWNENQDQGRADAKIMLEGWSRSIGLDFIVPVHSQAEISAVWAKLERLAKLTYPIYASSGFTGTYAKVTIGDLYKGEAMYVTDLSYDWDNETPWETAAGKQLPFYTQVSMTLGWIGKHRPDINTHVFTYNATT